MALNAPVVIDSPPITPALGGLLAVTDVIDSTDPHTRSGLQWVTFLCTRARVTGGCDVAVGVEVDAVKEFTGAELVEAPPFAVYAGVECDLFHAPYTQQVRDRLAGGEDQAVASAFWQQIAADSTSVNPVIVCSDEITCDNVVESVARLEQYAAAQYGGRPVLHMSRYTAAIAASSQAVFPTLDGSLVTAQGTPVANSAGYPDGVMFITGAVHAWRSPVDVHEAPSLATNTMLALAERTYAIAAECLIAVCGQPSVEEPVLEIDVPSPIAVTVDDPTVYVTSLANHGGPVAEATQVIRLESTDRALVAGDVTYETYDTGVWTEVTWFETEGALVYTEQYPIPAGMDATSPVRITVHADDLTNLTGSSLITGDFGVVLARATYQYVLSPSTAPTITDVTPNTGPLAGGTTVTVTGTGFEV